MTKILEIEVETCLSCRHHRANVRNGNIKHYCGDINKDIPDCTYDFPSWCPLSDKPKSEVER